jgi:ABC-type transport system involved in multi-copper enzyme maturation permease subunit
VIALLGVEVRRALARRMLLALIVLALGGVAVGGLITFVKSHPPSADVISQAQAQADADVQRCLNGRYVREKDLPPNTTLDEWCHQNITARNYYSSSTFHLWDLDNWLQGVSFLLVAGALAMGASFVGAEWHAGSMTTLLTWEPRRLRVLVAKTIAIAAVAFVVTIGLQAALSLVLTLVAVTRGDTAETGGAWLWSVVGSGLRISATASIASVMGLAVAMIGRNVSAALGGIFVYVAVIEQIFRAIRMKFGMWLLGDNVAVFITGRPRTFYDQTVTSFPGGGQSMAVSQPNVRTVGQAAVIVGLYAVVLLVAAAWSFRARDVN